MARSWAQRKVNKNGALSWDHQGTRTHLSEGSTGRPTGTQRSQSSLNRKDRNLLPLWDGSIGVEQPDSSSMKPTRTHLTLLIQRWTRQGSEDEAPSPGSRVTTDSVSKAKVTQRGTTKERGCHEGGVGGGGVGHTQCASQKGCEPSPTGMLALDAILQALCMCQGQYR